MSESRTKSKPRFAHLSHEMSNSLAYVVTNLNLLAEELEGQPNGREVKLQALVQDALEGSERLGDLLRSLRTLSWGVEVSNPPAQEATSTQRGRILVIDDEEAILTAVRRALRNHDVDIETHARKALARIADGSKYDLILCDLIMQGMTGMQLYSELTANHPQVADRVLFMTAGGFTGEIRDFLGNVNNGVLHKPFDVKTLRWLVDQKLREHSASR